MPSIHHVMTSDTITLDEEAIVLRVEHCGLHLRAGEPPHGFEVLPQREHGELTSIVIAVPPKHQHDAVAGDVGVAGHGHAAHVLLVRRGISCPRGARPAARDHRAFVDRSRATNGRRHAIKRPTGLWPPA